MTIAVLGSQGQLGRDFLSRLPNNTIALTRKHLDLQELDTIRPALEQSRPEVLINCAAYNLVDQAEADATLAFAVNTWGMKVLAQVCQELNIYLIHFSTDYVFGLDHQRESPYRIDDAPGPVCNYGLSKLCGEYSVRHNCPTAMVIRTCGLYGVWGSGGKGGNFVETMLRVAGQGKPLRVVHDQICTPSYTADVADAVIRFLPHRPSGLWHVTNSGQCSWYELAEAIFQEQGISADLTPITSAEFAAAARRPSYSVLDLTKTEQVIGPMRPWREALRLYLQERQMPKES